MKNRGLESPSAGLSAKKKQIQIRELRRLKKQSQPGQREGLRV
jgi:hypothetical protein